MPDHRSDDTRIPEWAIVPVYTGILCIMAALVFAIVSIGVYYLTLS